MDTNFLSELKTIINQYREKIQRITASDKDKKAIFFGGLGLLILILCITFQFFSSGSQKLERKARALHAELERFQSLRAEYLQSKSKVGEIAKTIKTGDESLISVIEKTLIEAQVGRESFSIDSRASTSGELYEETSADVEIKKISLEKAVDVLYKIQTMPTFLKVSKLRIQKRFDSPDSINISFRISTFKFNQAL